MYLKNEPVSKKPTLNTILQEPAGLLRKSFQILRKQIMAYAHLSKNRGNTNQIISLSQGHLAINDSQECHKKQKP